MKLFMVNSYFNLTSVIYIIFEPRLNFFSNSTIALNKFYIYKRIINISLNAKNVETFMAEFKFK